MKKVLQIIMPEELFREITKLAKEDHRSLSSFGFLILLKGLQDYKEGKDKKG